MKTILHLLLCLLCTVPSLSAQKLESRSFLKGRVSLKVPASFEIMDEEMLRFKYPMAARPTVVYTDHEASTNIALKLMPDKAKQGQMTAYADYFVSRFNKLYPTIEWRSHGTTTINGRRVGYLELITSANDTRIYNLMFFTDFDGQLLMCTFNCVVKDISQWQSAAKEIMHSLQIK